MTEKLPIADWRLRISDGWDEKNSSREHGANVSGKSFQRMKNFELLSFADADELAGAVAEAWLHEIELANRAGKGLCVALSGGRITHKFFEQTVEKARERAVSFHRVHFFWADERCVPPTDSESNFKLANDLLFEPLKISKNHIHRILGEKSPQTALQAAEEELSHFASTDKSGRPLLDLIFLGMGEDGHVASLFQNAMLTLSNDAKSNGPFIFVENSPKPPPRRISLSFNAIVGAKSVWVLVSGSGKEAALKESLGKGRTPLARVIQARAVTKIFSDIQGVVG